MNRTNQVRKHPYSGKAVPGEFDRLFGDMDHPLVEDTKKPEVKEIVNNLTVEEPKVEATSEKRGRGRPKGAKNKPKPLNLSNEELLSIAKERGILEVKEKAPSKPKAEATTTTKKPLTKKSSKKSVKEAIKNPSTLFEKIIRFILIPVIIASATLSIYYTGAFMTGITGITAIGFVISAAMYIYGCVGSNCAVWMRKNGKKGAALAVVITSYLTIGFSMCTSLFENGQSYYERSVAVVQDNKDDSSANTFYFDSLNQELADNEKQIENLNKQNDTLSTKWSQVWDTEKNMVVVREGVLSGAAVEGIAANNAKIEELQKRNKEIREITRDLATSGALVDESTKVFSFDDMLKKYLKFDSVYIKFLMLAFCSIFIDIIGPLAVSIIRKDN